MTDFLHGVEIVEISSGVRPVRTVKSAVIGLVGTAAFGPVNKPTLVAGSLQEGITKFGADVDTVTIPDALDAIFRQAGTAVVAVNVLNPATHKTAVAAKVYTLAATPADSVKLADLYPRSLAVQSDGAYPGTPYVAATDYTVDLATGIITRVTAGAIASGGTVWVSYTNSANAPVAGSNLSLTGNTLDLGATNITNVVVRRMAELQTYAATTDYTLDLATGTLTRVATGKIDAGQKLSVGYDKVNAAAVLASDIEGGVDAGTGVRTGVSALLDAQSVLGVTPRILIAPAYSENKNVADALISVANRLRAAVPIEGPSSTDAAAIAYRKGFGSRRAYVVDPDVQVAGATAGTVASAPNSAYVAGVIARSDNERGFWWSPSNREILGIVGTARPIDFALGDKNARANLLNDDEVATIIREEGYRLWGNRTCSSDTKWVFLSVVRTADILNDSLLRSHLWAVDRNLSKTYFEDVAEGVNEYIRDLKGRGALLGGRCFPSPGFNTKTSIAAGRAYFDIDFTPPAPAERLTFRSRLTNDYLEEILL